MEDQDRTDKPSSVSAERLEKAAYDYLGRYMASSETLRRVLERRVRRAASAGHVDVDAANQIIAGIILKCRQMGMVDDQRFADVRAVSLARRGDSPRAIEAKLAQKGIDPETARTALSRLADEQVADLELTVAIRLAERRRLGPFRDRERDALRDRDLAAMARAGHRLAIARTVIDAENPDVLRALVEQSIEDC